MIEVDTKRFQDALEAVLHRVSPDVLQYESRLIEAFHDKEKGKWEIQFVKSYYNVWERSFTTLTVMDGEIDEQLAIADYNPFVDTNGIDMAFNIVHTYICNQKHLASARFFFAKLERASWLFLYSCQTPDDQKLNLDIYVDIFSAVIYRVEETTFLENGGYITRDILANNTEKVG